MEMRELKLDGNAIAGELFDLFGVEMTIATGVCGECGAVDQVARLDVYVHAPGTVVRCPHCEAVLMRIVRGRDRVWLDLSGVRTIEILRGDAGRSPRL
jgi:Zn finger protein HypA/HybF involved in hydrogenase expression